MRNLRGSTLRILSSALLAGLVLTDAAMAHSPQPPQTFSEQVVVREREIQVSLPDSLRNARLQPGDFQVLVDGQPHEVTRAEPTSGPWTILVYVDQVLASPGTVFQSTVALAGRAADLTRLGTVEVAVAGPDPHTVLAPTREPRPVDQKLGGLSAAARLERDRRQAAKGAPPAPSDRQIRQQLDRLLAFISARHHSGPAGPRALFLVADGAALPAAQVAILDGDSAAAPGAAATPAGAYLHASHVLSSQGWVVIPVVARPGSPGDPVTPRSDLERFRESAAPSQHTNGPPPDLPLRPPKATALSYPGVVDLSTEPRLAPLRTLAGSTAGTVIGYDVQLPELLTDLGRRWTLWISEPEPKTAAAAENDRLHTLTVKLPGKKAEARGPAWLP